MYSRFMNLLMGVSARAISPRGAVLTALLVALPTIFSGFALDDYYHLSTLDGKSYGASTTDLFVFGTGEPEKTTALMASGIFPWYALPELKIHFFRPLSSLLMSIDYALFGRHAVFHHLHSLAWFALLAWAVALICRRALPAPVAGLALLFYILDDGHLGPVQWLSNRNALVSAVPALFGLAAHLRWREDGWRPGLPLSLLGFGVGVLGGETALGVSGFLIAFELIGRSDALRHRLGALVPAGLLFVLYLAGYKWAGFGVSGSGVYLDPVGNWRGFLAVAPVRLADLLGVQFFKLPVEAPFLVHTEIFDILLRLATLAALGVLVLIARHTWRELDPPTRRSMAWLCAGALLASVPALAAFPSGRLLTLPSLGAFALLAVFVHQCGGMVRESASRLNAGLARVLVAIHAVYAPGMWVVRSIAVPTVAVLSADAFELTGVDDAAIARQNVYSFCAGDLYTGFYSVVMRRELGLSESRSWQVFSQAPFDHEVTRVSANRVEIRVLDGEILSLPVEQFFRSPQYPLETGQVVQLDNFQVEVLEMGELGPTHISVTFKQVLDSPEYRFVAWEDGQLRPFIWPPVGVPTVLSSREGYFAWPYVKQNVFRTIAEQTGEQERTDRVAARVEPRGPVTDNIAGTHR